MIMKEILFRGFDGVNSEWIHGDLIHLTKGYAIRKLEDGIMDYTIVEEDSIGQFTGEVDEKGNKIFEDIIPSKVKTIR